MMQSPKDPNRFTKMICVESINFIDDVWGDCSLIEGQSYDVLIESDYHPTTYYHPNTYCLVKFGSGLCPHEIKRLKSESQIRDEKLDNILK